MEIASCFSIVLFSDLIVTSLHLALPAVTVQGYCCDSNKIRLTYRLNGMICLSVALSMLFFLPEAYIRWFYENYYCISMGANCLGLLLSSVLFAVGGDEKYERCLTVDQLGSIDRVRLAQKPPPSVLARFYLGSRWNPRIFGNYLDIKMLLYLIGAVDLAGVVFMQWKLEWLLGGAAPIAMTCYAFCFAWFIVDYLCGEAVHLYTYDLFAEKVGFKLCWGCLFFYPFFYPLSGFSLLSAAPGNDINETWAGSILLLFFSGWCITRGANLQKYFFRVYPAKRFVFAGWIEQRIVPGTSLLCSGFWGQARHFNYFGECLQAVAIALPCSLVASTTFYRWLPWLYPLYYALLFVPRQLDDDAVCEKKYGEAWKEYQRLVPYRIIPGVW